MSTASQLTRFAILGATRKRVADIFSLLFLAASILILSLTTSAFAQAGAPISGQWITPGGTPAAHAQIYVCPYTASGIPCYPQTQIYADIGLTVPLAQPFSADQYGNATFYVSPASYLVQVRVNGTITYSYAYQVSAAGLFNPVLISQGGTDCTTATCAKASIEAPIRFAENYSGTTADVSLNTCLTAALPRGTCDIRGWGGTTQSVAATVTVPSGVTLLGDLGEKFQPAAGFLGSSITTATYVSGGTFSGDGSVTLNTFNASCSGATATMAVAGGVPVLGSIVVTNGGTSCTGAPTMATCSSGTATCSGTLTLTSQGAPMFNIVPNGRVDGIWVDMSNLVADTWAGAVFNFKGFYTDGLVTSLHNFLITAMHQGTGTGVAITAGSTTPAYYIDVSDFSIYGTAANIALTTTTGGFINANTFSNFALSPSPMPGDTGNGIVMNTGGGEIGGNMFTNCNIEQSPSVTGYGVYFENSAVITSNQFQCNMWDGNTYSFYNAGNFGNTENNYFIGQLDKPAYDPAGLNTIINTITGAISVDVFSRNFTGLNSFANPPRFHTTAANNQQALRIYSSYITTGRYWSMGSYYGITDSDFTLCYNGAAGALLCALDVDNLGNLYQFGVKILNASGSLTAPSYTLPSAPAGSYVAADGTGAGTPVNSGTRWSPAFYNATGAAVSGTTPFTGLEYWSGSGAPAAASAAQVVAVIGATAVANATAATTAANLSGTPALPNGTTGTTQAANSADAKLATDNTVINAFATPPTAGYGSSTPEPVNATTSTANAYSGTGTATFVAQVGQGTGGSFVAPACATGYGCNSVSGTGTLTTGSAPTGASNVIYIAFSTTRTNIPTCVVSLWPATLVPYAVAPSGMTTSYGYFYYSGALPANTAMTFSYTCSGK
jgi:hypothetical protein